MSGIVHIAGIYVVINVNGEGRRMRQRCAWCGATLLDIDLERMDLQAKSPGGKNLMVSPEPWPVSAHILVDGNVKLVVEPEDGEDKDELPPGACTELDDLVTA